MKSNQTHSGNKEQTNSSSLKISKTRSYWRCCQYSSQILLVWPIFFKQWEMGKYTILSAPFLRSLLPPNTKIFRLRITFRVKKADVDNQYNLYSRTCAYESSILEGVYFNVSYVPVDGIRYLRIIVSISSAEDLIVFVLDISNAFQNNILPNPARIIYLSLPYIYL